MRLATVAAVGLLAGCGRIGYDAVGDGDAVDAPAACALRSVSIGREHACAVDPAGAVYCWGNNGLGKVATTGSGWRPAPTLVATPQPALDVTVNSGASCVRFADRTIACWGAAEGGAGGMALGAVTPVPLSGPVEQLVGGLGYFCARLDDGGVECWGDNVKGQLGTPASEFPRGPERVPGVAGAVDLVAGHRSVCARDQAGTATCWGDNRSGQLGLGAATALEPPTPAPALAGLDALAFGGRHGCDVRGGDVHCWGNNDQAQVAQAPGDLAAPGPARATGQRAVAVLARSTCALGADGVVSCWGLNRAGELGAGNFARGLTAQTIPGLRAARLFAGAHVACAESVDGGLWCWGDDTDGALGRGRQTLTTAPIAVAAGLPAPVVEVAVSGDTVCVALADGDVWCWGENQYGTIGDGTRDGSATPRRALDGTAADPVRRLTASGGQFCARDAGGLWCWGVGAPGDGSAGVNAQPRRGVTGAFGAIAVGLDHVCAIRNDQLLCWGENRLGQLGTGDLVDSFTPVVVTGVVSPRAVSANSNHTCAIDGTGALLCWGMNAQGQLGDPARPTIDPTPGPVALPAGANVMSVAAGNAHTCAIADTGALYCWGQGDSGQLGVIGPGQPTPTEVSAVGAVRAVYAHSDSTCVTGVDDVTRCFGANGSGALGNGGRGGGATPARFGDVDTASPIVALGASHDLRCAARADGQLYCAGRGSRGGLGPDLVSWSPGPVAIPCTP